MDDESELIRRVRMGDKVAYGELLGPYLGAAERLAYGMLQDRCTAKDCVQDASLRAWERFGTLQPGRSFRPWFFAIVANCCRDEQRGRWWRSVDRVANVEFPAVSAEDEWLAGADLRRALARLPHGQRVAIIMHFYLDLPLEEVAATLNMTVAGVKSRINRALRYLRLSLKGLGTDE